jgi:hypothetical protein
MVLTDGKTRECKEMESEGREGGVKVRSESVKPTKLMIWWA